MFLPLLTHSARDTIHSATAWLQNQHPGVSIAVSGDFNHVTLDMTLPPFTQDVVCPTKADRLHANVREAYSFSSFQLYVPTVKMQSVTTGGGQRAVLR